MSEHENTSQDTVEEEFKTPEGTEHILRVNNDSGDEKVAYLKRLPRPILERALGMISNPHKDPQFIRAGEMIMLACWISGDEEIKSDEEMLTAAAIQCAALVQRRDASLKKI